MIFLVLSGPSLEENLKTLNQCRNHIDGAELRADFLDNPFAEDIAGFFRRLPGLPLILTLRRPRDGGRLALPEDERERLFLRCINAGDFRYVDIEEDARLPAVEARAREKGAEIIRSFHDFEDVPEDLAARVRSLARQEGDIPKAAVMPKSCRGLERIIDAARELSGFKKILLGMGEYGFATRALAAKLGSYLTFASSGEEEPAPGLVSAKTLDEVYRCRKQGPETRVFGIIGRPILHSRSPHIHNAAYARLRIDAVYVPFHIDSVQSFLPVMKKLGARGLSVTSPFKEDIMPFCSHLEDAAKIIGACNTVVSGDEGLWGYNTDAEGFLAPLVERFPGGLSGLNAAVIGAGGAARSAVYALMSSGSNVLVLNRTKARAEKLAKDMALSFGEGQKSVLYAGLDREGFLLLDDYRGLIVNATTLGMHPHEDEEPLAGHDFRGDETLYDMVYSPRETLFLKRAALKGCSRVYGEEMLLAQAHRQFFLHTGESLHTVPAHGAHGGKT